MRWLSQLLILSTVLSSSLVAQAGSDWQSEREIADKLERSHQDDEALKHYRLALARVPSTDFVNRAYLLAQISTHYLRKRDWAEAKKALFAATSTVQQLQKLGHLNDDLVLAITSLREEINLHLYREKVSFAERKVLLVMSENLDVNCLPQQLDYNRCTDLARGYLGSADAPAALLCLERLEGHMKGDANDRFKLQLRKAVLNKVAGKPADFNRLSRELRARSDIATSACAIAEAQTWACDYNGVPITIAQARGQLAKAKKLDADVQSRLYQVEITNALDRGYYPLGEQLCRKWLALPQKAFTEKQIESVKGSLSVCLQQQNKSDITNAASLYNQSKSKQFEFLVDEEREAQKAIEQDRLKRRH
ncbi:MAG: hypothetical protein IPI39_17875 [Candidatus Obscuribacter sp.]|nr:hypothetical protein [Candidatus Obscuribacter sp.]